MSFISVSFLPFLFIVLVLRLTIGRNKTEKPYLLSLLMLSLLFYSWYIFHFVLILLFTTWVDYVAAKSMSNPNIPDNRRRWILATALTINIGLLVFFKYFDYVVSLVYYTGAAFGSAEFLPFKNFDLILPIGISFYTFHSMSYTIDVYRRRLQPIHKYWLFLLFVSFFPPMVAGPIVRAKLFLYQIFRRRRPRVTVFLSGLYLMIQGFFLKLVVADNLATTVNAQWGAGSRPHGDSLTSFLLVLFFSCQIFCDFVGYTQIARGVALLLGFRLSKNFNSPYIAMSFKEFWQRWHISLSSWWRDYLYIPLGGNRGSEFRTYRNLLVVMLIAGMWHGAGLNFLVWGLLHGIYLAVERILGIESSGKQPRLVRLGWFVMVQLGVLVGWVFFRSNTFSGAIAFLKNIAQGSLAAPDWKTWRVPLILVCPVVLMHLRAMLVEKFKFPEVSPFEKAAISGAMMYLILTAYGGSGEFIYFQF